jgi:hypothetical protein
MSFPSKFFCFVNQLKSGVEAGLTNIAFVLKNVSSHREVAGNYWQLLLVLHSECSSEI